MVQRFVDSGRGTKYRLSMSERLRQARLHSDFLASESAESTAAVQQTYVLLRPEHERKRPTQRSVEKFRARPRSQHIGAANH